MRTKNKAFTLTEIILAVMIIGLIFSIVSVSLAELRRSSRDTRRSSDIAQIQLILEEYYRDEGTYPDSLIPGESLLGPTGKIYLTKIPQNPQPASDQCEFKEYQYLKYQNKNSYFLDFCLEKKKEDFNQGANCLDPISNHSRSMNCFKCGEKLLDIRNDKEYQTIQIGNQCWMSENLNIGTRINSCSLSQCIIGTNCDQSCSSRSDVFVDQTNDELIEKYCYNDLEENCNNFGGFYQWPESLNIPYATCYNQECGNLIEEKHQGICPNAWHIPSDEEMKDLELYLGISELVIDDTGYRGENEGSKIASGEDWLDGDLKNNESFAEIQLKLLPTGYISSTGANLSYSITAGWWTSSEISNSTSWRRYLYYTYTQINRSSSSKRAAFPIRCVKD